MNPLHGGVLPGGRGRPPTVADGEVIRAGRVTEMLGLAGTDPQARTSQWEARVRAHCEGLASAVRRGHQLPPETAEAVHALLRAWGAGERYPELMAPRR